MTKWSPPGNADDYVLDDLDTYIEELEATGYFGNADTGENSDGDGDGDGDGADGEAENDGGADEAEGDAE